MAQVMGQGAAGKGNPPCLPHVCPKLAYQLGIALRLFITPPGPPLALCSTLAELSWGTAPPPSPLTFLPLRPHEPLKNSTTATPYAHNLPNYFCPPLPHGSEYLSEMATM